MLLIRWLHRSWLYAGHVQWKPSSCYHLNGSIASSFFPPFFYFIFFLHISKSYSQMRIASGHCSESIGATELCQGHRMRWHTYKRAFPREGKHNLRTGQMEYHPCVKQLFSRRVGSVCNVYEINYNNHTVPAAQVPVTPTEIYHGDTG